MKGKVTFKNGSLYCTKISVQRTVEEETISENGYRETVKEVEEEIHRTIVDKIAQSLLESTEEATVYLGRTVEERLPMRKRRFIRTVIVTRVNPVLDVSDASLGLEGKIPAAEHTLDGGLIRGLN